MKIDIRSQHVSVTDALKAYARKKTDKLERFFDHIQSVVIDLSVSDASSENSRQNVTVMVHVTGSVLRAEEAHADMYAAIDLVMDKMERQLKKYKQKLRDNQRESNHKQDYYRVLNTVDAKKKSKALDPDMLYRPKPMGPEDAAKVISDEHLPFLMFRNFETDRLNVIYPMGEDDFGLIEPN